MPIVCSESEVQSPDSSTGSAQGSALISAVETRAGKAARLANPQPPANDRLPDLVDSEITLDDVRQQQQVDSFVPQSVVV